MSQLLRQTLGGFRLVREIGRGGMGIVFEAVDLSLGRRVALKVLHPGIVKDEKASRRFQREAEALASLRHPSIVSIHSIGTEGEFHYIVLDYVPGRTLQSILDVIRRTPTMKLSAEQVQRIIEQPDEAVDAEAEAGTETLFLKRDEIFEPGQEPTPFRTGQREAPGRPVIAVFVEMVEKVARALDYAHQEGVIHRDVKPANILVDRNGEPHLMDFGLALEKGASAITRTGELIGTPAYMSPEQLVSRRITVDRRTDVYSLGILLYEVLTGLPPFRGRTSQEVIRAVLMSDPERPRRKNPNLSVDLETIVLKAMDKDTDNRYATAGELADDLGRFLRYEPILARPMSLLQRGRRFARRHKETTTAAIAGIVVVAGAAGYLAKTSIDFERQLRAKEEETRLADRQKVEEALDAGEAKLDIARRLLADVSERRAVAEALTPGDEALLAWVEVEGLLGKARAEAEAARGRFEVAFAMDRDDPRAAQGIADVSHAMAVDYESSGDLDKAALLIPEIRRNDREGKHAKWLEGRGAIHLESDPPRARAEIRPVVRGENGILGLGEPVATIVTGREGPTTLPIGNYVAILSMDGRVETRYPFLVRRLGNEKARVRLYRTEEVPEGFVPIPGGEVMLGHWSSLTNPPHRVFVDDFFMAVDEVTNLDYFEFVKAQGLADPRPISPRQLPGPPYRPLWDYKPDGSIAPWIDTGREPVIGISAIDAEAYCAWKRLNGVPQARLPSEVEWEKAARGVDGRIFPWGNSFSSTYCKLLDSGRISAILRPERIRSYPTDVSPYGIFDMAGSASELTSSDFDARKTHRVTRGSAWSGTVSDAVAHARNLVRPDLPRDHVGFRMAATPPFERR